MADECLISRSPEQTRRAARALLSRLPRRAVIALHGELGSGKTCFVQGLAAALGIGGPVTSPTFTFVNEYRGERLLCHVDLYRVRRPDEVPALGLDEYLETDGVTAIEWAERAAGLLPPDTVHVDLAVGPRSGQRLIRIRRPQEPPAESRPATPAPPPPDPPPA